MPVEPVVVSAAVAGRILQAAGLAAWVLSKNGEHDAAVECGEIQDVVDAALSVGRPAEVAVPREVAVRAADLWEAAARHLAAGPADDREVQRRAVQLERRAEDLRSKLRS